MLPCHMGVHVLYVIGGSSRLTLKLSLKLNNITCPKTDSRENKERYSPMGNHSPGLGITIKAMIEKRYHGDTMVDILGGSSVLGA